MILVLCGCRGLKIVVNESLISSLPGDRIHVSFLHLSFLCVWLIAKYPLVSWKTTPFFRNVSTNVVQNIRNILPLTNPIKTLENGRCDGVHVSMHCRSDRRCRIAIQECVDSVLGSESIDFSLGVLYIKFTWKSSMSLNPSFTRWG